jgi:hypothetical protein
MQLMTNKHIRSHPTKRGRGENHGHCRSSCRRCDHRGRACRSDGGLPAWKTGFQRHCHRKGSQARGRDQPDGRARRLPLRYRRAPLLFQVAGSRRPVERHPAGRVHPAPADEPYLLRKQVLQLPLVRLRRVTQARHRTLQPVHGELRLGPDVPKEIGAQPGGLGRQPVRRAAVLDLLQDLYREGVGHAVRRDFRGLGGPAHQGD